MYTMKDWNRIEELTPIHERISEEVAASFPGKDAVNILVGMTKQNFATIAEAEAGAVAFVNERRKMLTEEALAGNSVELPAN